MLATLEIVVVVVVVVQALVADQALVGLSISITTGWHGGW
jgi:hypothetical protein